jgi:hypothetical protein
MNSFLFASMFATCLGVVSPPHLDAASTRSAAPVTYASIPQPGKQIALDADHYFIYGFDKPPKLGTRVMKVEIYSRDGKRDTSFVVKGDADMPSMRGAHSSGDMEFSRSARGTYLLPVRLVMPGDWEIRFTFMKKDAVIFRGAYLFDL